MRQSNGSSIFIAARLCGGNHPFAADEQGGPPHHYDGEIMYSVAARGEAEL